MIRAEPPFGPGVVPQRAAYFIEVKALSALVAFLTTYDSACGLQSSWCAMVAQSQFGPSAFDESEAQVRLVDKRFRRARNAYLALETRDQDILCLVFNECPDKAHVKLREVKGMDITLGEGEGTKTNLALLTAWCHGLQPLELLARHKGDPKSVPQMIANAMGHLSGSLARFQEAFDASH